MIPRVRSVVVLGAGTMGSQLACLLAGAGASLMDFGIDWQGLLVWEAG